MKGPKVRVIHRDAAWMALDKPAGMPTTAPPGAGVASLTDRAKTIVPDARLHHPLSRLDVEVTGVVLFALTRKAAEAAERARDAGDYRRLYVALLPAAPVPATGEWTWAISVDPRDANHRTTGAGADTKPARTRYATVAVAPGGVALVVFRPVTGRTHQIRVHAAAAGVAVLGDVAYGGVRRCVLDDGGAVSAPRVMLHAWAVSIPGGPRVLADVPADMTAAWEAAGGDPAVVAAPPSGEL